jgi:tetratricopeptide (TPR) repeat protein
MLALGAVACGAPADPAALADLVNQARRLDLGGEHDAAIALYRQALDRDAASFDAHYGIGRALDLAGEYDEARVHFARAIDLADEGAKDQALRMMGVSWAFSRNVEEAARAFGQVFDRRVAAGSLSGASEVANELGRVYLELGDPDRAETWYRTGWETAGREADRRASQIDLADMRWAHAQARIAARRGQADEARRHAAEVRRLLDTGGNQDQEVQYAYLMGYVEFHLGNHEAALDALQQADQEDPFILLLQAQASEQLGRDEAALEFHRAVMRSASHAVANAFARPIAREKTPTTDQARQRRAPRERSGAKGSPRASVQGGPGAKPPGLIRTSPETA